MRTPLPRARPRRQPPDHLGDRGEEILSALGTLRPLLTAALDNALAQGDAGAALVGIDSANIDDTRGRVRPVHTLLLDREIPVVEHLTGLSALPARGATFTAVPPKVAGMSTFPVRAFATLTDPTD